MKNWIIIFGIVSIIGAAGAGLTQMQQTADQHSNQDQRLISTSDHNSSNPGVVTMHITPMTPAQWARFCKTGQFTGAAMIAMQAGNYALAETKARQALASGPDAGFAQETLAAALDAQGTSQEALQAYKVIADSGGIFPRNLLPYALLELKAGHWSQAATAYNKALPLLSDGDLVQKCSDFSPDVPRPKDLATALHIALGLESDCWQYHGTHQAMLHQSLGQFQQAVALEPNSSLTNYYYGYGLKLVGRQAEAEVAFRKAAVLGEGDVKKAAQEELPIAAVSR